MRLGNPKASFGLFLGFHYICHNMKRALIITGLIIAIIFIAELGVQLWLEAKVRHAVGHSVASLGDSTSRIDIGRVSVNLLRRSITLHDVAAHIGGIRSGDKTATLYLRMGRLGAGGINIKDSTLILGRLEAELKEISVAKDSLAVSRNISRKKEPHHDSGKPAAGRKITGKIKGVEIGEIRFGAGSMTQVTVGGRDTVSLSVKGLKASISGFGSYADTPGGLAGALKNSRIEATARELEYGLPKVISRLRLDTVTLDSQKGTLTMTSLSLTPLTSKELYPYRTGRDWVEVVTGAIECSGIDFGRMAESRELHIDSIGIAGAELRDRKDRNAHQLERYRYLFWETIHRWPFSIEVGKVAIRDLYAHYEEIAAGADTPGVIFFNRIDADLEGLTNMPSSTNQYMTLKASGRVMDEAVVSATMLLPVHPDNDLFHVTGSLGEMDMEPFNAILDPLVRQARIKSGRIKRMDFKIEGREHRSSTVMTFLYDGLDVEMLRIKDGKPIERTLLTNIANWFVIDDSNPLHGKIRTTETSATRDTSRSQFSYLWRSLMEGIKESVGVGKRKKH